VNMLAFAVAAWIFCVGVYGAIVSRNLIRLAVCLTVTQSSTYVLLLAIATSITRARRSSRASSSARRPSIPSSSR
jgi:multisubunit Na+/H+ antiporter MnhC subunit